MKRKRVYATILTFDEVGQLRRLYRNGVTLAALVAALDGRVSLEAVRQAIIGKTWADHPEPVVPDAWSRKENAMNELEAPAGTVWICHACGKRARHRYDGGIDHGWDVSCMSHAVLCDENSLRFDERGKLIGARAMICPEKPE